MVPPRPRDFCSWRASLAGLENDDIVAPEHQANTSCLP